MLAGQVVADAASWEGLALCAAAFGLSVILALGVTVLAVWLSRQ